ncbi:hypothetical protein B0T14DRAFT_591937 [Immersiella caudata]|uniref:Heterokaryon incompatibility domain-containing protein n=1 Tax=Immersiella caudata TaxID=314043 RepID=A0AA39WEH8_9PEZI|nr:hypothetical protein B0T14DRAFT_591937 [Immersiella caudata]
MQQIPLTGNIYELAKRVIIYLGAGDENSKFVVWRLRAEYWQERQERMGLASMLMLTTVERLLSGPLLSHVQKHKHEEDDEMPWIPRMATADALDILDQAWFTRIWTVQELATAQKAETMWGTESMGWDFLVTALSANHTSPDRGNSQLLFQPTPRLRRFLLYEDAQAFVRRNEPQPESIDTDSPASKLLLAYHGQHATEPRDVVFALGGILKRVGYRLVDLEPENPLPKYTTRREST